MIKNPFAIVLVHCPRSRLLSISSYPFAAGTPDAGDALTPDAGDAFEEDAFAVVRYQFRPQQRELSGAEIVANLMISLSYFLCLLEKKKRHRRAVFLVICALNGMFLLPMVEGANTFMDKAHSSAESERVKETEREQTSAEETERALKMHRWNLLRAESVEDEESADEVVLPPESTDLITRRIRRGNSSGADGAEEQSSATGHSSVAEAATSFFSGLFRASDRIRAAKIEEAESQTIVEVAKTKAESADADEAGAARAKIEEDESAKAWVAEVTTTSEADAKARALIAESEAAEYRRLLAETNKAAPPAAVAAAAGPTMNRDGARPVSRRMVTVTNQAEFVAAIADDTTIELAADIYLSSQIDIDGITGLVINGNGFKIDAGASSSNRRRCMYIDGGSQVTMNQLTVTGGYVVSEGREKTYLGSLCVVYC